MPPTGVIPGGYILTQNGHDHEVYVHIKHIYVFDVYVSCCLAV